MDGAPEDRGIVFNPLFSWLDSSPKYYYQKHRRWAMLMNCWLLQGQLVIKEVAYAANQVFCQASFGWLIHYECQGVSLKVSGVGCQVSGKINIEAKAVEDPV